MHKSRYDHLLYHVFFVLLLIFIPGNLWSQSRLPANPDTYLASSEGNGDRDDTNVIFFQVPTTVNDTLYFAVFDAESGTGGFPDQEDVTTTYSLYGGNGAYSDPAVTAYSYDDQTGKSAATGTLLQTESTDGSGTYDGLNQRWTYMPGVAPNMGERVGNFYYFKLVVTSTGGRNGYRVDVSNTNYNDPWGTASGTPASIPDVRAFAYIWTPMFGSGQTGVVWDLYPFIPDGTTGNIQTFTWDWDSGATATGPVLYNTSGTQINGNVTTSDQSSNYTISTTDLADNVTMSESSISGADNGTWHLEITDGGGGQAQNPSEVWFGQGASNLDDLTVVEIPTLFKTYASPYFPEPPHHVTGTPVDGIALGDGAEVERVLLQLVDENGNPAPYIQNVYLSVNNGAQIEATSDEAGPLNAAERVVSTDSSGYAWVEISNNIISDTVTTLTIKTDGVASAAPGPTTCDRLPDTGTLGVNDSPQITFLADALPTAVSNSGTTFSEGFSSDIDYITISEGGTVPSITAANEIRITIPASQNVTFDTTVNVRLIVTNGGSGGRVDNDQTTADGVGVTNYLGTLRYENGDKTAVIDVATDFETDDSIQIGDGTDNLTLIAAGDSDCNFFLEFSFDGDTTAEVTDDKLIIVENTANTFTWTGNFDTSWTEALNWDDGGAGTGRFPGEGAGGDSDSVVIPSGIVQYPVLGGNEIIDNLSIAANAELDLVSNVLTINGAVSNEGRLILTGSVGQGAGLTAGGSFDVDSGTIEYSGGGSLQLNTYNNLEISSGSYTLGVDLDVNGDLTVGGTLNDGGNTIFLAGDLNLTGTLTASGTFEFDGSGVSVTSGAPGFQNLTIDTPGKTVLFDNTNTTTVNGELVIVGANGNPVTLDTDSGTTIWTFDNGDATPDVQYVSVDHSDLLSNTIDAFYSTDGGTNDTETGGDGATWTFNAAVVTTWQGGDGGGPTDWDINANWDNGAPGAGDTAIIPVTVNQPIVAAGTGPVSIKNLTIQAGAVVDINGENFTVTGNFTNLGTFKLEGGEIVSIALNTDSGEIVYDGTAGSYAGLLLGDTYYDLTFSGTASYQMDAALTVNGDLTINSGTLDASGGVYTIDVGDDLTGAGTLTGGTGTITVPGDFTVTNYTHNNGEVVLTATGNISALTFYDLTSGGGTRTLIGSLTIDNNLTVSGGTLDLSGGAFNLNIAGDADFTGAAFSKGTGTMTFNGGGAQAFTPNSRDFGTVQVSTAGTVVTQTGTTAMDNLTIDAGTEYHLDGTAAAVTLNINNGGTLTNNNVLQVTDDTNTITLQETSGAGTFSFTGTDIEYNGGAISLGGVGSYAPAAVLAAGETITMVGNCTFSAGLTASGAGAGITTGTYTLTAAGLTVDENAFLNASGGGGINASGNVDFAGAANDGTFSKDAGGTAVLIFNSGGAQSLWFGGNDLGNIQLSTAATNLTLQDTGDFDDVTLDVNTTLTTTQNFSAAGDFANNGTLAITGGTATFDGGAGQTISGTGTGGFYNLTINKGGGTLDNTTLVTAANDLTVTAGTFQLNGANLDVNHDVFLNGGTLDANGRTITVAEDWNNGGGTFADTATGSTVLFDTAADSVLSGQNVFSNLSCTTGGKHIKIDHTAADPDLTVDDITITGTDAANLIYLESSVAANQWTILVNTSENITFASITDSVVDDTSFGNLTPASTLNGGNNDEGLAGVYWVFPAFVWDGSSSSDWETPANWNMDLVPGPFDDVQIPNVGANPYPVMSANVAIADLDISDAAASVSTAGFDLTVSGTLTSLGTLRLRGDETTVSIASPAVIPGTTEYYGTGAGAAHVGLPAGYSYTTLVFNDTGGTPDSWTLGADLSTADTLDVTSGELITDTNALTIGGTTTVDDTLTATAQLAADPTSITGGLGGTGTAAFGWGNVTISGDLSVTSFTASSAITSVAGGITAGTYTHNSGTLVLNGTGSHTVNGYTFSTLEINKSGGGNTITAGGPWVVTTAFTMTQGTWNAGSDIHQIAGNWDSDSPNFTLTPATSTIRLTTTDADIDVKGADSFNNLTIDDGAALNAASEALAVGGDLTLTAGTMVTGAIDMTVTGTADINDTLNASGGGNINFGGTVDFTGGSYTAGAGTISFTNAAAQSLTAPGTSLGTTQLTGAATNLSLNNDTIFGALTINGGTTLTTGDNSLTASSITLDGTLNGTGMLDPNLLSVTGNVTGTGTLNGRTLATPAVIDIDGNLSIGTLSASAGTSRVGGDYNVTSLTHNSGTIVFDNTGGSTVTTNAETFNNVRVSANASVAGGFTLDSNLTVDDGVTLTVGDNSLDVTGNITDTTGPGTGTVALGTQPANVEGHVTIGTLTTTSGTIDINGNLDITNFTASSTTTNIGGDYTVGTLTHSNGLIIFDGTAGSTVHGEAFYDVRTDVNTTMTGAWTVANDLTVNGGTLTTGNNGLAVTGNAAVDGTLNAVAMVNPTTFTVGGNLTDGVGTGTVNGGSWTVDVEGEVSVNTYSATSGTTNAGSSFTVTNFTHNDGRVILDTATAGNLEGLSFYDLEIAKGAGTITSVNAGITVTNSLTLTSGEWDAASFNHSIAGSWDSTGFTFTENTSTITLTGAAPAITTAGFADSFNNLVINPGDATTASNLGVGANLTVATGASLAVAATDLQVTGNTTLNGTGALSATTGDITLTGTLTGGAGSSFDGGNGAVNIDGDVTGVASFTASTTTTNLAGATVTFASFTHNSGTLEFDGAGTSLTCTGEQFNDVIINGTVTLQDSFDVNGNITVTGTLIDNTLAITSAGDWDSSAGTLTATGSVNFDGGAAQSVQSADSFAAVTVSNGSVAGVSGDSNLTMTSLTINGGSDLTMSGAFTLTVNGNAGINGDLISGTGLVSVTGNLTGTGTFTAGGNADIDGNMTVSIYTAAAAGTTNVGGNWGVTAFTPNNGTVIFDGAGTVNNTAFYNLTNSAGARTASAGFSTANLLSITGGSVTADTGGPVSAHTATLNGGNMTVTAPAAFTVTTGDLTVQNAASTYSGSAAVTVSSGNLAVSNGAYSPSGTTAITTGDLNVSGGTSNPTGTVTLNGADGDLSVSNGTITFDATVTLNGGTGGVSVSGGTLTSNDLIDIGENISVTGGIWDGTGAINAAGSVNLTNAAGDLQGGARIITVTDGTWNESAAVFTPGTSTVILDGGTATMITTSSPVSFHNLTINRTGVTTDIANALVLSGSLDIQDGTFDVTASDFQLTVGGNWTVDAAATFEARSGTVIFDGGATSTLTSGAASTGDANHDFYNITVTENTGTNQGTRVNTAANPVAITGTLTIAGPATIGENVFNDGGLDLSVTTLDNSEVLELHGTETVTITNMDVNSGLVRYVGTSAGTVYDLVAAAGNTDYFQFEIDSPNDSTFTMENDTFVDSSVNVVNGGLNLGGFDLSIGPANPASLYIAAGNTLSMSNGQLSVDGDIDNNGTISITDSLTIQLKGSWINNGSFNPGTGTVEFLDNTKASVVRGSSTFNNFTCTTPGKSIWFEAGETQTIKAGGNFQIIGTAVNEINLLSTYTDDPTFTTDTWPDPATNVLPSPIDPPHTDATEQDHPANSGELIAAMQWNISIVPGASVTADYIYVELSYSDRTIVPDNLSVHPTFDGNHNWVTLVDIDASWTLDTDYNGKIDAIAVRVEFNTPLDTGVPSDAFAGLNISVDGYTVSGYETDLSDSGGFQFWDGVTNPLFDANFFIMLQENSVLDTGNTPIWRINSNNTLQATTANAQYVATTADQTPFDQAKPFIGYTLAKPDDNKIFIHFSEPVYQTGAVTSPAAGDFSYTGAAGINGMSYISLASDGTGVKEALFSLDAPITAAEIAGGTALNVDSELVDATNNTLAIADQPDWYDNTVGQISYMAIANTASHRVSDLALGWANGGMINPVWASDGTARSPERGGLGVIREFDGSQWIQDKNILLESAVHPDIAAAGLNPTVFFDTNVSDTYILNDVWLPTYSDDLTVAGDFNGLVPQPNLDTSSIAGTAHPSGSENLWQFTFPGDDPKMVSGNEIGFFFQIPGANPLYGARLESPNASDWYRSVRPWKFRLQDIIKQRSGISILNNVINPLRGEKATLHYVLDTGGMITINVFNLAGDLIDVLYRGRREAGEYSTTWDGRNRGGRPVARGVYFIRVVGPKIDEYRKVMVVK